MENTKVLFIPTTNAGVTYWRHWNFANAIHRTGAGQAQVMWYDKKQLDLAPWEYTLQEAVGQGDYATMYRITNDIWAALRQSDAVVFGMIHCRAALDLFESVIELRDSGNLRNVPVMMEIDDNILSVPVQNPAFAAYAPGSEIRKVTERQLRISDGIIVSTPYLHDIYREYNPSVYVVPNSIDFDLWGRLKNKPKPGIRIGWSGGAAHREDLAIIEDVIPRVLDAHRDVKFVFFHGLAEFMFDLEKKYPGRIELHKKWVDIDKYPATIAGMDWDICLAPLIDSSFNRAKSNLRWLEGAALGTPCIASNVGHFAETITNHTDGILCDTPADWFKYLSRLITDKRLRKGMGMRARQKAFERFNVDTQAAVYIKAIEECGNIVADRAIPAAQKDLEVREGKDEHDKIAIADPCLTDGGGPRAESVC